MIPETQKDTCKIVKVTRAFFFFPARNAPPICWVLGKLPTKRIPRMGEQPVFFATDFNDRIPLTGRFLVFGSPPIRR